MAFILSYMTTSGICVNVDFNISPLEAFPVYAFHPLITDDTGTQGKHNLELEVAFQAEHDSYRWFDRSPESVLEGLFGSVYTRDDASELGLTVSYGIIDPLDVVIGFPS